MARSRYKIVDDYPYFLTITFVRWIPLFSFKPIAEICLDSIRFLQDSTDLKLYSWVFMENHMHLVISSDNHSKFLLRFKSYTAKLILEYLKESGSSSVLTDLHWAKTDHKKGQTYQVWQDGAHPIRITNSQMMVQKVEYIHNNPVNRGYVDMSREWRYSSARAYNGESGLLDICKEW